MLDAEDRKFLLGVLAAPRRAHNIAAHKMAERLMSAELLEMIRLGGVAQRELALKLAALPQTLSGECLQCAMHAGEVLEREVKRIEVAGSFLRSIRAACGPPESA